MKDESEPVTPDEVVVRLVWHTLFRPDFEVAVRHRAFEPKPGETDGISVFRAACLSKPEDVLAVIAEEKKDLYAVTLLPVAELFALGLSVRPARIETIVGHAVLPELNIESFEADKLRWREIEKKLAVLASNNVVRRPKT